jgi:tetratricopeptide (TPR) repeat protein
MKIYLAAAAAVAMLAAVPAHAAMFTAGSTSAEDCFRAAQSGASSVRALASCNTALASDLSFNARTGTLLNRATVRAAAGDNQAAVSDYNAAIARDASQADAYMGRGTALLRQGRYSEAKADLTRALTMGVSDAHVAYFNRAGAEEASGDKVAAYHDYQRARSLAPDFQPANIELARFRVNNSRVADAR